MRVKMKVRQLFAQILVATIAMFSLPTSSTAYAASQHSVPGLLHCVESRSCDIKNANLHFVDYSSVCNFADCNFVAAADWEKVAIHTQPTADLIKIDYGAAHQTFGGGLNMNDLWSYWEQSGIDGAFATAVTVRSHSQGSVQNGVLDRGALIAELEVSKNSSLANQLGVYNTVLAIVDGFDPKGPVLVCETKTTQLTWAQWNSSVRAVWDISTTESPATPPPTTTTVVPPTTTTTVIQTSTVTFNANGGSGVMSNEIAATNAGAALTLNSFTYSGYSFNDWNTAPNGGGSSYADGALYSFATSVTLYAQWTTTTPPPFAGMTTPNWSGYVFPSSSILTETSAKWTVPTLNCADTANADSSTWVGIGGFGWSTGGNSGVLLQTGTDDGCVNGAQRDYGWWELYPSTPNHSQPFSSFTVSPGNSMEAYVYQQSNGAWVTQLDNLTTGLSGTMITGGGWGVAPTGARFTYQGTTSGLTYSGGYTA